MSVSTRHRFTFIACAVVLAPALFAAAPSGRTSSRMVYDAKSNYMVLFGGSTKVDAGTRLSYDLNDTWAWVGDHWVQLFPATSPHGRSFQTMVYDSNHNRTLLFGGKSGTALADTIYYDDTWQFDGTNWSQINTPNQPSKRFYPGSAYDPVHDRWVLFGGTFITADGKTTTNYNDTWEFDGTTWTQKSTSGPSVVKPILVYDSKNDRIVMIASDTKEAVSMYAYDQKTSTWTQLTPDKLPDCASDAQMVYQNHVDNIVLFGGVCQASSVSGSTWEFDGTTWATVANASDPDRVGGEAMAYDPTRQETVIFGGTLAFGNPTGGTHLYQNQVWATPPEDRTPAGRSLFSFVTNPDDKLIWLYGGQNDSTLGAEFWSYAGGEWTKLTLEKGPTSCGTSNAAYDSDRKKLVVLCADSSTYEWDGSAWKSFTAAKTWPQSRSWSMMSYNPTIKKTVMFGGYGTVDYLAETWVWDGTTWTRVKKNPAPPRALAAMWFDSKLNKTVLFGGIGRKNSDSRVDRFNDMWTFDGTGWSQIKNVPSAPAPRYGMQTAIDPRSGKVLLFGGLVLQVNGATQEQIYSNDLWSWDGTTWTKVTPNGATPPPRENGALAYDPSSGQMVLFAGYAGYYLSDLWLYDAQNTWNVQAESTNPPVVINPRRRGAGH
jgi:hypothetical protein